MCKVVVLLGIFCVCLCERWNWEKDYISLLSLSLSPRLTLMQPGDKIEKNVSITATSPGTKVLIATFSHRNSPSVVSRCFHKVSITREWHWKVHRANKPQQQDAAKAHTHFVTLWHVICLLPLSLQYCIWIFFPPLTLRKVDIVKFVVYIIIQCFCIWPNLSINRFNVLLYMHKNIWYMNSVSGEVMHTYVHTKHTAQ